MIRTGKVHSKYTLAFYRWAQDRRLPESGSRLAASAYPWGVFFWQTPWFRRCKKLTQTNTHLTSQGISSLCGSPAHRLVGPHSASSSVSSTVFLMFSPCFPYSMIENTSEGAGGLTPPVGIVSRANIFSLHLDLFYLTLRYSFSVMPVWWLVRC